MEIEVHVETSDPETASRALGQTLGFGRVFADQMFRIQFKEDRGWHGAAIVPYGPLQLDPSALVFHYGQEIFEGHKAYRWSDDRIALFRPEANAERLNDSAARMMMPPIPVETQLEATLALVGRLKHWVPRDSGSSLYLRPTMIATEPGLGVRPAKEYLHMIIASPVGPYYPSGFSPIKVRAEAHYIRAAAGGTGSAKTGGNYGGALRAQVEAHEAGYDAVLWLDASEHRYVEEIGAMNVMFVLDGKLVTSELRGTILPGVTRDSVLTMAKDLGLETEERAVSIDELIEGCRTGRLAEAFGVGTAAVVTPIGVIGWKGEDSEIRDGSIGPVARKVYDTLTGIQYGRREDPYGWMRMVP
jgi:branched-chain amino acid aminotransferase